MSDKKHVLVATLGGQPQIITFTLDLLLQAGYPISKVIAVHPEAYPESRLQHSLHRLHEEFTDDYYWFAQRTIHFQSQVLEIDGQPIHDIVDSNHADGTLDTIHHLINDLKRHGHHIHLSVSGGRRMMALLAISVATLNFDRHDHVWHINTPEDTKRVANEGSIMHVPTDAGIRLIEGPFIALGSYIYSPVRSFHIAQQEQREQMEAQEHARCKQVVERTTPAQLKVLRALARGLHPREVASELHVSPATVNSHCTFLYSYCREVWNIPKNEQLSYHFFEAKFGNYLAEASDTVDHNTLES
jgi:CRISPR-associated protein Csx14